MHTTPRIQYCYSHKIILNEIAELQGTLYWEGIEILESPQKHEHWFQLFFENGRFWHKKCS